MLAVLAGGAASACGFYFPWQMLAAREQTMRDLPVDSFAFEAAHLASRSEPQLPPARTFSMGEASPGAAINEERRLLDATQQAQVAAMRAQATAAGALAVAGSLPAPVRDYVAGAVAFAHGDVAAAVPLFRAALGSASQVHVPPQALWAAYMLGRSLAELGDAAGATAAFRRTRALVAGSTRPATSPVLLTDPVVRVPIPGGVADPMELGLASLGGEARVWLAASGLVVHDPGLLAPDPPSAPPTSAGLAALDAATALYAQQAAYGEGWGVESLQILAEALISDPRWLAAAVTRPLPRSLVIAYALASTGYAPPNDRDNLQGSGTFALNIPSEAAATSVLDRLVEALHGEAPRNWEDADRLAALAYLRGRYDLAERLTIGVPGPLGLWVRAKLTLQHHDLAATAAAFDEALHTLDGFGHRGWPRAMGARVSDRLRAEPGVVAMARGDFDLALRVLYAAPPTYWGDVAYIAERVLTTDELQGFVQRHAAAVPVLPALPRGLEGRPDVALSASNPSPDTGFDRARELRGLLARRLMRDGRAHEAAETFTYADLRREAADYDVALRLAGTAFWRTDRAHAAWDAATILHRDGMELSGTTIGPDQELLDGSFPGVLAASWPAGDAFTTNAEGRRYDASRPQPDLRYHYRYVAMRQAALAASGLPPRSQAFAAVLCHASDWALRTQDAPLAGGYYRDYVAHGAVVPFATDFGHHCPEPDFAGAARLRWTLPLRQVAGPARHHPILLAATGTALLLGTGLVRLALTRRGRRRKA